MKLDPEKELAALRLLRACGAADDVRAAVLALAPADLDAVKLATGEKLIPRLVETAVRYHENTTITARVIDAQFAEAKVRRLDSLSLPHLHIAAVQEADPVAALAAYIEDLRGQLDRAAAWRVGTPWYVDREAELVLSESQLARIAPGHPFLPDNIQHMTPTGPAHVEPVHGEVVAMFQADEPEEVQDEPVKPKGIGR